MYLFTINGGNNNLDVDYNLMCPYIWTCFLDVIFGQAWPDSMMAQALLSCSTICSGPQKMFML